MPRATGDELTVESKLLPNIEKVLEKASQRPLPPIKTHYRFVEKFWTQIDQMVAMGKSPEYIAEELNRDFKEAGISVILEPERLDHAIRSMKRNARKS